MKIKGHLTPEGLEKIMEIKADMNNNNNNRCYLLMMNSEVGDDTEGIDFC